MARGTLLIGCGGAGKGILNHVKEAVLEKYSSLDEAGIVMLGIDGPLPEGDSAYMTPSGVLLDSSQGAREFYPLKRVPEKMIKDIKEGSRNSNEPALEYTKHYITSEEAADLMEKITQFDPQQGMGGCRGVGLSNFMMEVPNIQDRISEALNRTRNFFQQSLGDNDEIGRNRQLTIFVIGSQIGGTGTGQLLNVAQLVKKNMDVNANLSLVVLLPDSYSHVFKDLSDNRSYADAKGFAGLREMGRMRESEPVYDLIEFSDNIAIKYNNLFDLCYLVSGTQGSAFDLSDFPPIEGVVPVSADMLTSIVLDDRKYVTDAINWVAQELATKHFSAFGSFVWRFPAKRLKSKFTMMFGRKIYEKILNDDNLDDADVYAKNLMESTRFTKMALDYEQHGTIATAPEEWHALMENLSVNVDPEPWPCTDGYDAMYLPKEISTANLMNMVGPHNSEVKQDANSQMDAYIGKPTDAFASTVSGWLNINSKDVLNEFSLSLINMFREMFYEQDDDGKWTPRPLNKGKANSIVVARAFLNSVQSMLQKFKTKLEEDYRNLRNVEDPEKPGNLIALSVYRRREVEKMEAYMDEGRDRSLQKDYLEIIQLELEAHVWETVMEASARLADEIDNLVKISWDWVGSSTTGWISYLNDICLDSINKELTKLDNIGKRDESIKCRSYFPRMNTDAEMKFFEDVTHIDDLVDECLSKLSWKLGEVKDSSSPKSELASRQLILSTEIPQDDENLLSTVNLKDLVSGNVRETQLGIHKPTEILAFGSTRIFPKINTRNVWDALYFEYKFNWLSREKKQEDEFSMNEFVNLRVKEMLDKSQVQFSNHENAQKGGIDWVYGDFITSGDDGRNKLAAAFHEELRKTFEYMVTDKRYNDDVRILRLAQGVAEQEWAYYHTARLAYYNNEEKDIKPTVNLYPHEKYAYNVEQVIKDIRRDPDAHPLSPKITRYMKRSNEFELLILALLEGLFDKVDHPDHPGSKTRIGILVDEYGTNKELLLHESMNIHSLTNNFLAYVGEFKPEAKIIREAIEKRYEERMKKIGGEKERFEFFKKLLKKAETYLDQTGVGALEIEDADEKEDWRDLFKAVIIKTAKSYGVNIG